MNTSINADKGTTINELELTLRACEKLCKAKIESSPCSGYIMAKGEPNEARIKYVEVLEHLNTLYNKFAADGAFSLGVCRTCSNYRVNGSTSDFGVCKANSNKSVHCYDSCSNHSKQGGGFGL